MNKWLPCGRRGASPGISRLAWCVVVGLLGGAVVPVGAHDGHTHDPLGQWFFWPDYTLERAARPGLGTPWESPRTPFGRVDAETAPLLFLGERPTERVSRLLGEQPLPAQAFSVELWLVDHVNQPVGALVTAKGRTAEDEPGWVLGYRSRQAFFTLRAGAEPEPITLETSLNAGFKRYWHHLVATYDGLGTMRLYVNGQLAKETSATGSVVLPPRSELEVAAYLQREPHMELANLVREVRLYDDDIGATQVRERFEALSGMVEQGVIHADRFHFTAGPYLNQMTETEVTVVWETDQPSTGVLRYGLKAPGDQEVRSTTEGRLHRVEIQGLEPETTYYYQLTCHTAGGDTVATGSLSFKTAVRADSPVTFAVIGDTESRPHINNQIAKAIWGERPDFTICVGDLTDGGKAHHKFEWNLEYFLGMNQLVSRVPMFPVPGNGESDLHWYLRYHGLAETGHRYAFRYGNAEFFMLDSNRPMGPGSEQYDWLEKALQQSTARWKFACHHHPVYTSDENDYGDAFVGPAGTGDNNPRSAVPLYEKYGVDMVFYGHIHAYERTWPMAEGQVNLQRGVRYVQTGGAGGNLEDFGPTRNRFSGKLFRGHHYCLLDLHGDHLQFRMFDVEGRLRDAFEVRKGGGAGR